MFVRCYYCCNKKQIWCTHLQLQAYLSTYKLLVSVDFNWTHYVRQLSRAVVAVDMSFFGSLAATTDE